MGNSRIPNSLSLKRQSYSGLQSKHDRFARFFSSFYDEPNPDGADLNISVHHLIYIRPERLSGSQTSFFDNLHITTLDVENALPGVDIKVKLDQISFQIFS